MISERLLFSTDQPATSVAHNRAASMFYDQMGEDLGASAEDFRNSHASSVDASSFEGLLLPATKSVADIDTISQRFHMRHGSSMGQKGRNLAASMEERSFLKVHKSARDTSTLGIMNLLSG